MDANWWNFIRSRDVDSTQTFQKIVPSGSDIIQCDEEQGAVRKPARERRQLRDQAGVILRFACRCVVISFLGSGLERSYSRMSVLAWKRAIEKRNFLWA